MPSHRWRALSSMSMCLMLIGRMESEFSLDFLGEAGVPLYSHRRAERRGEAKAGRGVTA